MNSPGVAVLTCVHGEHDQLMNQVGGIAVGSRVPDLHVVVAMADPAVARNKLPITSDRWRTITKAAQTPNPRRLPVAAARNLAATTAVEAGAEVLIFLDVGCIPGSRMVETYADRVSAGGHPAPAVWFGQSRPLPPAPHFGYSLYRLEDQSAPLATESLLPSDYEAVETDFLSFPGRAFAITAADFAATGGFHAAFRGVAGIDADFAQVVRAAGGTLVRIGDATAYRQPCPRSTTRPDGVAQTVLNANLYLDRWGEPHPIEDLPELSAAGLVHLDPASGRWLQAT